MVRSLSEYYTSMSISGLPTFLISVKNMNLLSSSIYKHLETYLIGGRIMIGFIVVVVRQ